MAVRALWDENMRDIPLPLALDFYEVIVDSLVEESAERYQKLIEKLSFQLKGARNPEETMFSNWKEATNTLHLTKGFTSIFDNPVEALWVAYASLGKVLDICNEEGEAGYLQVFSFDKRKYWTVVEGSHVVFLLPQEY